jgi:TolB-like protein
MRFAAILVLLLACTLRADPATQPAVPATQPVCDVYIAPFSALGDNSLEWAGKAVSQNLLTDLARRGYHPLEGDKPQNSTDALTAGKAVNAKYLITGTYQTLELQVRFNGQIVDVNTGNVVGGMSVTGSPRDLFALEDSLSAQAINQLSQVGLAGTVVKPALPVAPGVAAPQPALAQLIQPPAVAAPNAGTSYEGSALQAYVDSNRTPSVEFAQQVQNAQDQMDNGWQYGDSPYFYGGYGYGIGVYVGVPYGGYGYGNGFHGEASHGSRFYGSGFYRGGSYGEGFHIGFHTGHDHADMH